MGLAVNVTTGPAVDTVTVADCEAVPPAPVQVRMNFDVEVSAGVVTAPLVAWAPAQPPDAVQEVALVEDQVSAEVAPLFTVVGLADKVTAGAAVVTETVATWDALPPDPVQLSE